MRLLHTRDLRFEEFFDRNLPDYAILSHRWGPDEVSYQDFLAGQKQDRAGYAKILACCKYAASSSISSHFTYYDTAFNSERYPLVVGPFDWVWIDTCCIDKSSSAELSEAINSMYDWYSKSRICFVYLSDVNLVEMEHKPAHFRLSKWFTRGWTLQELLAPERVQFLDASWQPIGGREELEAEIATAAGIASQHINIFHVYAYREVVSVAEKLSWTSNRSTTRREDQAYCLMGLFDINMPLLYGEGSKALRRLLAEIIRSTNDESIFIWDLPFRYRDPLPTQGAHCGLLATRTDNIREIFHHLLSKGPELSRPPYAITNQGLELRVPRQLALKDEFFLPLKYRCYEGAVVKGVYAIRLVRGGSSVKGGGTWHRNFSKSLPETLPYLSAVVCNGMVSFGLYIAPEEWLWSREQLAETESEVIYAEL